MKRMFVKMLSSCFVVLTFCGSMGVALAKDLSGDGAFSKDVFIQTLQERLSSEPLSAALDMFSQVPDSYSDDFDLQFLKAALYLSGERYAEAKAICTRLNAKNPNNTDVLSLSLAIAQAQGNSAERSKYIKALLAIDQYNSDANIAYAQDYFSRKNYKQSRLYYQKALVHDPDNQEALFGVGQTSYFLEDDEKAESVFKQMIAKDPYYAPAYAYLGKLAAASNENKVALDYAQKAVAIEPDNYDYLLDYGQYQRSLGQYENAIASWSHAIEIDSSYFLAYAYRAGIYDEQENYAQALEDYRMVVKLNPKYYFAYESIGILALHEEMWTEAREAFMKCYEYDLANRKNDYKLINISYPLMVTYCYFKEKKPMEAKKFSEKILPKLNYNVTTDSKPIEYWMLRVFHDQNDRGLNMPQKINAVSNTNKRGKMWFYMGLLYDMAGGVEAARQFYSEVLKLNSPMFFEYRLAEWSMKSVN